MDHDREDVINVPDYRMCLEAVNRSCGMRVIPEDSNGAAWPHGLQDLQVQNDVETGAVRL
jgi:hypothetical protein